GNLFQTTLCHRSRLGWARGFVTACCIRTTARSRLVTLVRRGWALAVRAAARLLVIRHEYSKIPNNPLKSGGEIKAAMRKTGHLDTAIGMQTHAPLDQPAYGLGIDVIVSGQTALCQGLCIMAVQDRHNALGNDGTIIQQRC